MHVQRGFATDPFRGANAGPGCGTGPEIGYRLAFAKRGVARSVRALTESAGGAEGGPGGLAASVAAAARRGSDYLMSLQRGGGDWEGEMVWCTMILAQTVIVRTIVGRPHDEVDKAAILRHFAWDQRADGSWGMHPESPGYVFFTTIAYIALRLLGQPPDDAMLSRARAWLHATPGGVASIPSWGKFWLSLLGLYDRSGLNAIPPEIFLLPQWFPVHPSRFYCHTRQIYLGIAYLSGSRFEASLPGDVRGALRRELYPQPYEEIDFGSHRHSIAPSDLFVPITPVLRAAYNLLGVFERWHPAGLRRRALEVCFDRIVYEQRSSRYQGISPVSSLLNCLAIFSRDPSHPDLAPSLDGIEAWRWEDDAEGLRYVGARSNSWDTAFAMQALLDAPESSAAVDCSLDRAHGFLDRAQMTEELPEFQRYWRDSALGGWCFSGGRHQWPVSDCAAEALSAILAWYAKAPAEFAARLPRERLRSAVRFLLSRQNDDGGFGTYERRRGGALLEKINPSEMYGQCMTELSYLECTASSLAALVHYRQYDPDFLGSELDRAIARARRLLRQEQQPDGSYPGFWGINYTYAIFHVVKGLRAAGLGAEDAGLQSAARWLVEKQRADGGWGEHYTSCLLGRYVEHEQSQPVMTSWALLALLDIVPSDHPAIQRGIAWLVQNQTAQGGWVRGAVNGVFFGAAMLDYRLYPAYFPVWALNRYLRLSRLAHPHDDTSRHAETQFGY